MKNVFRRFANRKTYMNFAKNAYKNLIFLTVFLCFMLLAIVCAIDNQMYDFSLPKSNLKVITSHEAIYAQRYTTGGQLWQLLLTGTGQRKTIQLKE